MGLMLEKTHKEIVGVLEGGLYSGKVTEESVQDLLRNKGLLQELIRQLCSGDIVLKEGEMLVIHRSGTLCLK